MCLKQDNVDTVSIVTALQHIDDVSPIAGADADYVDRPRARVQIVRNHS